MDTNKKIREHVSALCDGALADEDVELGLAALRSAAGAAAWTTYHHIGDVLRNTPGPALSPGFNAALARRLQQETPARPASGQAAASSADILYPLAAAPNDAS